MPEQQLQKKVQNLERIEKYLKQQVSELEDDRQELYDLLREDKKLIHELRIKVRTLELSEGNVKNRLDRMADEESRLIEENYNLSNKIQELEIQMSLAAKKMGANKGQMTDPYEAEELNELKLQLEEKNRKIESFLNASNSPETLSKTTSTEDMELRDEKLESELQDREVEVKKLKAEVEDLRARMTRADKTTRDVQTAESSFDANRIVHTEVQSDESFFHKRPEKTAACQTEENDSVNWKNVDCQTEDVEVQDRKTRKNQNVQVEQTEKSLSTNGVQTDDDLILDDRVNVLEKELLEAKEELKKKETDLEELEQATSETHKEISRLETEKSSSKEKVEKLTREGKLLKEMFEKFVEASKSEKAKHEEEVQRLKDSVANKETHLNLVSDEQLKINDKLRATQIELVSAETSREEKAGTLLAKILEITQLKKNISDKDDEVKTLWTDMNKIQANYSNYIETSETERALLENRLKEATREVTLKQEELDASGRELERVAEKLKKKDEEIASLQENKNDLVRESSQMKKTLRDREDEMKLLLEDFNKLQAKYVSLVQDHEKCTSTEEELSKNLESCRNDLRVFRDKNLDLTREVDFKETKLKILTSANSDQEERLKTLEDENLNLREQINKTELRNEFLNSTNEQKMRIVTSALLKQQNEKKSEEASIASQIAFLKKSLQSKDEEIQLLTNDINSLHKKYLELLEKPAIIPEESQSRNDSRLHSELARKDEEVKTLMNNGEVLQKKLLGLIEAVQRTKIDSEQEKSKLMKELKDKMLNLNEKSKKHEEIVEELKKKAKLELNESERRVVDLKDKLLKAANALKASSQHNKELLVHQKNASHVSAQKESLEKKVEQMEKNHYDEVTKMKANLETLSKEKKDLEQRLDESKRRLMNLERESLMRSQLEERVNDLLRMQQEKDGQLLHLSGKVDSMRGEVDSLLEEKRQFLQRESYFKNLQNEIEELEKIRQKQDQNLKNYQIRENKFLNQLKEKDSMIKGLNSELAECMELSRKLNILSVSR